MKTYKIFVMNHDRKVLASSSPCSESSLEIIFDSIRQEVGFTIPQEKGCVCLFPASSLQNLFVEVVEQN